MCTKLRNILFPLENTYCDTVYAYFAEVHAIHSTPVFTVLLHVDYTRLLMLLHLSYQIILYMHATKPARTKHVCKNTRV